MKYAVMLLADILNLPSGPRPVPLPATWSSPTVHVRYGVSCANVGVVIQTMAVSAEDTEREENILKGKGCQKHYDYR